MEDTVNGVIGPLVDLNVAEEPETVTLHLLALEEPAATQIWLSRKPQMVINLSQSIMLTFLLKLA